MLSALKRKHCPPSPESALKAALGREHTLTLVSDKPSFQFTPSNPWVGVGWRKKQDISVELAPLMTKFGIAFSSQGAKRLNPNESSIETIFEAGLHQFIQEFIARNRQVAQAIEHDYRFYA